MVNTKAREKQKSPTICLLEQ